jgi:hypothetical protein
LIQPSALACSHYSSATGRHLLSCSFLSK